MIVRQATDFLAWAGQENIPEPATINYNDLMGYVQGFGYQQLLDELQADVKKFYPF